MHMAANDGGPLQEDLVLVGAWLVKVSVLEPQALELRGPEREVRRVGLRIAEGAVDVLGKVKEEARIKAPGQTRFKVAVEPKGIAMSEICGWWYRWIGRKAANRPLLTIVENFGAPDETTVRGLAEGDIAIRN